MYQPTSASAAAWRRFIDTELSELRQVNKWVSAAVDDLASFYQGELFITSG